jgi:1-acyl-sn-glycerol-3-phosphate acyltransferase
MIYVILRQYCRFVIFRFFIRKIEVLGKENIPKNGPVLFASNHPNSFLDGILLNCILDRPLWSLARGDAFKKPWVKTFLNKCYLMPIYRLSEGKENLRKNDDTFERCEEIFAQNGQVLIFSEGLCTNQSALLPLKKGTARLTQQLWQEAELPLVVLPTGITYDSYARFGKSIKVEFGKPILKTEFANLEQEGFFTRTFNEKLQTQLLKLSYQTLTPSKISDNFLFYIGIVLHFPVYALTSYIAKSKTRNTVFHDSVFFLLLIILLPLYWLLLYLLIRI